MSSSALAAGLRHLRGKLTAHECRDDSDEQLLDAFTSRRDDNAFAVLVRRHGPMVLQVCRRVLGHDQDAEDAFQATFLVLARNAASLRNKTRLASFLHGIAFRTAMKAKQTAARRRKHEGSLGARTQPRSPANVEDELLWREVRSLLDEEIARLPEIYRVVLVLFYLQDLSREETARRLGLKEVTVAKRLAEARKRLQGRLAKRGVELTAVLAACAVATPPVSAVPVGLAASTIEAALAMRTGEQLAGVASAGIVELVQNVTTALIVRKAKMAALLLAAASLLAGAGAWTCGILATPHPADPWVEPAPSPLTATKTRQEQREQKSTEVSVSGRVVDPDGKPVGGAKLLFLYPSREKDLHQVWATSAADGRFQFVVPRRLVETPRSKTPWEDTHVLAAAEGHGFAVARLGKAGTTDLMLRLVKDDVPIRGRILDLQGRPVAGARIRMGSTLAVPTKGYLTDWIAALKKPTSDLNSVYWANLTGYSSSAFDLLFPSVTTGSDGRFCVRGIGRERMAELRIEGPTLATQVIHAMTRPREAIHLTKEKNSPRRRTLSYFGATFDVVAAPSRPVVGVVRDRDTGKPLAGVVIESELMITYSSFDFLRTVTDKEGRYRLMGLPKGDGIEIVATTKDFPSPSGDDMTKQTPYLSAIKDVGNPLGIEPVTVDFGLKRGVWVKGRVTEKTTGKSVTAHVEYFCFDENPNAKEIAFPTSLYYTRWTREDGSFLIPALPGRGLIAVRADEDHYIMGAGAEHIKDADPDRQNGIFSTVPHRCYAGNFHALVEINPKRGEEAIRCDIALDSGRSLKGTVFGPDGKPLAGARVSGLKDMGYWLDSGAEFIVESLQPNKPRVLQFLHEGKKLAGVLVLNGDEKGPISVRLEPWAALAGRLVSLRGEPLTGLDVHCRVLVNRDGKPLDTAALFTRVDKDGRFRIEGLAPGFEYHEFNVLKDSYLWELVEGEPKNLKFKAGETKDLGDRKVKPEE